MTTVSPHSLLTEDDVRKFKEGRHYELYKVLGSHTIERDGVAGTHFAVWAPSARAVHVVGSFNGWDRSQHALHARWDSSGIYEGFIPDVGKGELYKYAITTQEGAVLEKGDPFALHWETPPKTASVVWDTWYEWKDDAWMQKRRSRNANEHPVSVYEVHIGSWKRDGKRQYTYRELIDQLVPYVVDMGYTHVEFMPVMEHPFYGSWGYQITGYFAPTSRFGTPQDFMALVDAFHAAGVGVLLDWVPSHFPNDPHGLDRFDGTHLYEHADPRKGFHPDWKSNIFNYGRYEVRSFLISNARFWVDRYHADGLRVDAVASMLYLDYSRKEGEWIPNQHGGNENLEAISLLKEFNEAIYSDFPGAMTIAEESTSFSGVSRPTYTGGLGFGQKWMMGWMHDALEYFKEDPIHRRYHQNAITFSLVYAFTENFQLPLSHDEVVHGKGPIVDRMPGDEWQKFANLRLLYAMQYTHPGTQLNFMGNEIGQTSEWHHERQLDWWLLDHAPHQGVQALTRSLNELYRTEPAFWRKQFSPEGFAWIDYNDHANSVLSYLRKGDPEQGDRDVVVVANMTPVVREGYRIGVPGAGTYQTLLNTDDKQYFGSGTATTAQYEAEEIAQHGLSHSINLTLPPLAIVILAV